MSTAPMQHTCGNCGTVSDPTRRFCRRCGTWLVTPTLVAPAPPDRLGTRLRRGWRGGGPYSGDLTRGTVAFRVLSVLAALLVLVLVLTLVGWHPIRRTTDLVGHVLGTGRVSTTTLKAQAVPGDAFPGMPALWAVDDVRGRGFATRWTAGGDGNPNSVCAGATPATTSSLEVTFPQPTDVREIGIEAGLPADDAQLAARWRPRTLELRWSDGACQVVQLEKTPELQRFPVAEDVPLTGVTVVIVAGYPPESQGSDRLDIGEITFWQR